MAQPLSGIELSQEQLEKVEEFIEEEEGSLNRYRGWLARHVPCDGRGLELRVPPLRRVLDRAHRPVIFLGFFAIASLAAGLQGWALAKTNLLERALLVMGGLQAIAPVNSLDLVGVGVSVAALPLRIASTLRSSRSRSRACVRGSR